MKGQSCMVMGRRGVGPMRFRGASLCWGRRVTFEAHRWAVTYQDHWVHLARHTKALVGVTDGEQHLQKLVPHVPQMWGSSGLSPLV